MAANIITTTCEIHTRKHISELKWTISDYSYWPGEMFTNKSHNNTKILPKASIDYQQYRDNKCGHSWRIHHRKCPAKKQKQQKLTVDCYGTRRKPQNKVYSCNRIRQKQWTLIVNCNKIVNKHNRS